MKSICFGFGKRTFYGSDFNSSDFNHNKSIFTANTFKRVCFLLLFTASASQVTARPLPNGAASDAPLKDVKDVKDVTLGGTATWYGPYEYSNTVYKPFICPDQQVLKGRKQLDIKTWYLCIPLTINGIRVKPDRIGWSEQRQENSNWDYNCPQHKVMVGMQHWNTFVYGYTRYRCAGLTDAYSSKYVLYDYARIEAVYEFKGMPAVCPEGKVLTGRYYIPDSEITQYQCAFIWKTGSTTESSAPMEKTGSTTESSAP